MTNPITQIHNEDGIAGLRDRVLDNSVHLTVTSIPFEELFTYSGKLEDVGNNGSTIDIRTGRFALNLRFVIAQLFRVTAPGCNVCIHIQQLLAYKNQHGFAGRRDFRGAVIDLFMAAGFHFHCEVAIPKDPQAMAQRLSLHSLQFKTGWNRDSNAWAIAPNDYVLVFNKPGVCAAPVRPLIAFDGGWKPLTREVFYAMNDEKDPHAYAAYLREEAARRPSKNPNGWISTHDWVKWAAGVWGDIDEFDVIDGARSAKESDEEKHVCPLQLEVIRRLVLFYSNPVDVQPDVTVLDNFMGVGSTAAICVELHRNCIGFELKESYHANALKNAERWRKKQDAKVEQPGLFATA